MLKILDVTTALDDKLTVENILIKYIHQLRTSHYKLSGNMAYQSLAIAFQVK